MIISSSVNSFVDFNGVPVNCRGSEVDTALPAYDNFGAKFQFSVLDELVPSNTVFYVAICTPDCETIYDPNYQAVHICNRYVFNVSGVPLEDEDFPIVVNNYTPGPYQPQINAGSYDRSSLLSALSSGYEFTFPGYDFITCCGDDVPTVSGISVTLASGGGPVDLQISSYFSNAYVNFPATSMAAYVALGDCFTYCILNASKQVIGCSNLFVRIFDPCYTSVFTYYNEENSYGFKYVVLPDGSITENQIRLYVNFNRPTFQTQETIFRQSNNIQKRISTNTLRLWQGNVGYFSEDQHHKMYHLLKHDYLHVYYANKSINRQMLQTGDYTPDYPEIDDFIVAPATFTITDFLFGFTNNNCGFSCGVEVLDSCTTSLSPGGCTSKYHIEFAIPTGDMGVGATTYTNSNLIGASDLEVYREGLIQYKIGDNYFSFNSGTGTVTVFPPVSVGERFSIWVV